MYYLTRLRKALHETRRYRLYFLEEANFPSSDSKHSSQTWKYVKTQSQNR